MRIVGLPPFLLLFVLFFFTGQADAQQITYEKGTFDQVLAKAKEQNKPVFLFLDIPPLPPSSIYYHKKKAPIGLEAPEAAKAYNDQFLNLKVAHNSEEGALLRKRFAVTQFPMQLYLNPDGQLIHRSFGHSMSPVKYLNDINTFKREAKGTCNLSYFAQEYQKGRRNADFLLQYIQLYRKMGIPPTQELLDAHAGSLPLNAFNVFSTVHFIHEQGPVVGGKAYALSRSNRKIIDSLYKTLPLEQRIKINNGIIQNTLQLAKDTKDKDLAWKGANFARNTYSSNVVAGQRSYENHMISFYKDTKDTANYLAQATRFYENYYMAMPIDSVKKIMAREQVILKERIANSASAKKAAEAAKPAPGKTVFTERFATISPGQTSGHLSSLNDAAYSFYLTGTTHVPYLDKALSWSKRTVELAPTSAAFHDTMAHLLYRLQSFTEAEAAQKKAIDLAKKDKLPTQEFEKSLERMKARTL